MLKAGQMYERITDGRVSEVASIIHHGEASLVGRSIYTSDGPKVIKMVRPFRYKACTIHFEDGSSQTRDFDETFHLVPKAG